MTSTTKSSRRSFGVDQAEGLRSLFGGLEPKLVCLSSALDADSAVTLALGTAHALRKLGVKVLLIDEIDLAARKKVYQLPYPIKYDMAQVFENHVSLDQAIVEAEENLWFASGMRMRKAMKAKALKKPTLLERLEKTDFDFDLILISTLAAKDTPHRFYGQQVLNILVTSLESKDLAKTLDFIHAISVHNTDVLPTLMVGGDSEQKADAVFAKLANTSEKMMDQQLDYLGWIPTMEIPGAVGDDRSPGGLVLPARMFVKIAETANRLGQES